VKWVYGIGFAIWTLATLLTGFAGGFAALLACRILLGIGESVAYPCYGKILSSQLPEQRRGLANSLIDAGTKGGPGLGTYIGSILIGSLGWRPFFWIVGGAGLLWLPPWMRTKLSALPTQRAKAATPSYAQILKHRAAWGTFLGLFFFNYEYYFIITWLPSYLVNERKMSLQQMGIAGSLPFLGCVAMSILFGYLSDRWIRGGADAGRTRRGILLAGQLVSVASLPFVTVQNPTMSLLFLAISLAGLGISTSNLWALTQTLAGPEAAGRWTGAQNGFGNLGGVVAPIVTGAIVQGTGSFYWAFLASTLALLLSGICYAVVLGPVRPVFSPKPLETQPRHSP
jgi:MFS family permease